MTYGELFNPWRSFRGAYIPLSIIHTPLLSSNAKLAYARLSQLAGRDGCCRPKMSALAKDLGCSKRTASRLLRELENTGLIWREINAGPGWSNVIHFLWHELLGPETPADTPLV